MGFRVQGAKSKYSEYRNSDSGLLKLQMGFYPKTISYLMGDRGLLLEFGDGISREINERVRTMALEGKVVAMDGTEIELKADTLCVHGDNPAAVEMVKKIRQELKDAGVVVIPMKWFI